MGESKNKGGRPKGSGKKHEYLGIALTTEDKEKLKKYAEQHGITMTKAIEKLIAGLNVELEPEENS